MGFQNFDEFIYNLFEHLKFELLTMINFFDDIGFELNCFTRFIYNQLSPPQSIREAFFLRGRDIDSF